MDDKLASLFSEEDADLAPGDDVPALEVKATKATKVGTIYFVRSGNDGRYIKIGWTMWPEQRLRELQTGSPHILSMVATEEGKTQQDEKALHKRFKQYRRWGEWFHVKGELGEYLSALGCWCPSIPGVKPRSPRHLERLTAQKKKDEP